MQKNSPTPQTDQIAVVGSPRDLNEPRVKGVNKLVPGTLLRINQFIPDLLPISKSHYWDGVKKGIFPQPIKLGPRVTVWKADDLIVLIEKGASNV